MAFSAELVFAGVVAVIVVALMLWFKKTTKTFSVDLPYGKDVIYDFLKTPSILQQIHPSIEAVENTREKEGRFYFEVLENLGSLTGKKRVAMSLESYKDPSTHKAYIRLENHDTLVKVYILLVISHYNPLAKMWSTQFPSLSAESQTSPFSPESIPRTPPPSPATPADQGQTPRSTVHVRVEVSLIGGLVQLIARHLVQVWKTSLSNTDKLLSSST